MLVRSISNFRPSKRLDVELHVGDGAILHRLQRPSVARQYYRARPRFDVFVPDSIHNAPLTLKERGTSLKRQAGLVVHVSKGDAIGVQPLPLV
jgi:hypothetical protein